MTGPLRDVPATGPGHERVAAVLGGRTGSGYLLAPRVVLTAAHVVAGQESARVVAVRGAGEQVCRVVWRRHDEWCDAALLVADRDLLRPAVASRLRPVSWGRLSDDAPIGDCQVIGFPRASWQGGGRLDTEHIECALRPGSGIVRDRYVLDVKDVSPDLASGQSPWEGMSGAALFARGHLLGVVVAAPRNWRHRRLEAVKSRVLLDDPGFRAALAGQVRGAPEVAELSATTRRRTPLVLAGRPHVSGPDLAATIRAEWDAARRQFFDTMGTPDQPAEGWRSLLTWLRQFDDPAHHDVEGRLALVDRWLTDPGLPPDVKLLRLLAWLDRDGEPVWRGERVTLAGLTEACLAGRLADDGPAHRLYQDLGGGALLDALSEFAALHPLRGTQEAWDEACAAWWRLVDEADDSLPDDVREWARGPARGLLLAAVLPGADARESLRAAAGRLEPPTPGTVGWYDWLVARHGVPDSPVGRLLRIDMTAFAVAEARRTAQEMVEARQREFFGRMMHTAVLEHDRGWAAAEVARLSAASRCGAVLRAVAWFAVWGAAMVAVSWLVWGAAEPAIARTLSGILATLSLVTAVFKVPGAWRLGGAYRPPLSPSAVRGVAPVRKAAVLIVLLAGGAAVAFPVVGGVLVHDLGRVPGGFVVLPVAWVFWVRVSGLLHDWDAAHRERLRVYQAERANPLGHIAQDVRSPSPRVRADAFMALLRTMAGSPSGNEPPRYDRDQRRNA
ncbi:trypsin-like peptidase domain-containing protein [Streptomyces sp. URMC 129]|uniref:trypsin-like peptidase domain-containing protein n=1 Tax=Streptomyces sp. URMC 129 TaxID=3423407 RepID=UPI003F1C7C3D